MKNLKITVGDMAEIRKTFSEQEVALYAKISGDRNPVHLDESFAKGTRFGRRVVHGLLTASLISAVLGTKLPGPGAIYLSQTLNFRAPVYLGDTVTASAEVIEVREDKSIITLRTICTNQKNELVIEGKAVIMLSSS